MSDRILDWNIVCRLLEVFCRLGVGLCRYQTKKRKGTLQTEFYIEHQGLEKPDFFMQTSSILFEAFLFPDREKLEFCLQSGLSYPFRSRMW